MGLGKIKYVEVIKDVDEEKSEYMKLFRLGIRVTDEKKREQIFKDAMLHKYGLDGEKRVIYELKNSFIPMHIFHNVRLEEDGYTAQIDVMALTNYGIFFIETKQLFGDIEITEKDEFIRHFKNSKGRYYKKEAMYNPNQQVARQRTVFDEIAKRHGKHKKLVFKFSTIVLSNPKSILNKNKAGDILKARVIKIDQLVKYIKSTIHGFPVILTNSMIEYSKFIQENHKEPEYDYLKRYGLKEADLLPERNLTTDEMDEIIRMYREKEDMLPVLEEYSLETDDENEVDVIKDDMKKKKTGISDGELRKRLREYRVEQSKKLGIDLGFVFSNATVEYLIEKKPTTYSDVCKTPGFGAKKKERHAEDIANIIKESVS